MKLIEIDGFSISVYNILLFLLIFSCVIILNRSIDLVVRKRFQKHGVQEEGRSRSVHQITRYLIYIVGFLFAMQSIGIKADFILGAFAALGLGIGFALQDVFKDFISGIIILFEGNVTVGDILEVDGLVGTVKEIKLRTSLIRTRDGIYIVVPNNRVVNEKVTNWTTNTKITRFNVSIGVAYGSDIELVKDLLLQVVDENESVSKRPLPMVYFTDFGSSSLDFKIHYWIHDTWNAEIIKSEIRFAIDKLFKENNIQIPFPQRDVHLIQH